MPKTKSKHPIKDKRITIAVLASQHEIIRQNALKLNLSISKYVLSRLLSDEKKK